MPIGRVTMNDVLVDQRVDHRHRGTIAALRLFLVALRDGVVDLTNGGAHARAQRDIVSAVLIGLPGRFFR